MGEGSVVGIQPLDKSFPLSTMGNAICRCADDAGLSKLFLTEPIQSLSVKVKKNDATGANEYLLAVRHLVKWYVRLHVYYWCWWV